MRTPQCNIPFDEARGAVVPPTFGPPPPPPSFGSAAGGIRQLSVGCALCRWAMAAVKNASGKKTLAGFFASGFHTRSKPRLGPTRYIAHD